MTNKSSKNRLVRIDMMVGMAMLMVVMGHFSVGFEPQWYHGLHNWIYSFHMQMFLFLSAFLIRYTYKGTSSLKEYGLYIWRKFKKFFLWFLVIGMGVALLACLFKNAPFTTDYLLHSLRNLLLYPRWSEASFLWYIYILFGFYLISPLFFLLPQWVRVLCCIGAMFLAMLDGTAFLATSDFCSLTFFYCLGVLCAEWIDEIKGVKVWMWGLLAVPFVAFSAWLFSQGEAIGFEFPQLGWWSLVTGTAALPCFYLLAMAFEKMRPIKATLSSISRNCYWIYLLQMFIIWGCARLAHSSIHSGTITFIPFFIITTVLTIALPIALSELTHRVLCRESKSTADNKKSK